MQTAPTPLRLAPHPSPCGPPLDGGVESFHVVLPRRSVSPRGVVRPAEVWRMAQELAVQAACKLGWPPERFRSQHTAFIVAEMTVRHLRELAYGERVVGSTWVQDLRRGTISHRQLQLDATQGPFAVATQRWVHVYQADDGSIHVGRASDALLEAFAPHPRPEPLVELPALPPCAGPRLPPLDVDIWLTWMDPIGHLNHPQYLDFCDEALARAVLARGGDPQAIVPVAERLSFRAAASAGDRLRVELQVVGQQGPDLALAATLRRQDGAICCQGTLIRRLEGEDLCLALSEEAVAAA